MQSGVRFPDGPPFLCRLLAELADALRSRRSAERRECSNHSRATKFDAAPKGATMGSLRLAALIAADRPDIKRKT